MIFSGIMCFEMFPHTCSGRLRSRLVRRGAFSSQRHEATSSSTVPSGYKDIETKAYVAVASKAECCCHVAS